MATAQDYYRARARYYAQREGIDPDIFERQIGAESRFDPNAVSRAGAIGIAQIVPRWHPGVNPRDPEASLSYAARWVRQLLAKYGNWRDALSVYNSGRPWSVGQRFEETRSYVNRILGGKNVSAAPPIQFSADPDMTDYAFAESCYIGGNRTSNTLVACASMKIAQRMGLSPNNPSVRARAQLAAKKVLVNYSNQVPTGVGSAIGATFGVGTMPGDTSIPGAQEVVGIGEFVGKLGDWHVWLRVVEVIAGGVAIFYGVKILATGQMPGLPNPLK